MLDAICITIAILPWRILIGWFTATIVTIETSISGIKELDAYKFPTKRKQLRGCIG